MISIDHLINCRFTYLLMVPICYMPIELYADRDISERVVNAELSKVQEWLAAKDLPLNAKKSNLVIFHPYQKKIDHEVILKIFDIGANEFVPLNQKTYIGTFIDSILHGNTKFPILTASN